MLLAGLWVAPLVPLATQRAYRAYGIALDGVVLLGVLFGLQFVARAWSQPARWRGSWRAWLVAVPWALWVTYELGRLASREATNEVLPIYDLLLLSRHLFILVRDLYGMWARVGVAAAVALPFLIWAIGALALGRLEAVARAVGPRPAGITLAGLVAVAFGLSFLPATRWVTPDFVDNLSESLDLAVAVRKDIRTQPHRDLVDRDLSRTPDVHIYIVESYGDVVRTDEALKDRWAPVVDTMEVTLQQQGWHTASGLSVAPVHGGRSWIADASMLTGLHVARQATYEHVISMADRLDHFPKLFAGHGYRTVLVRPKDRARPGVELVNHFRFADTYFFEDFLYEGPVVGWGHIPDQYTIDFVHWAVLDDAPEPTFAFFHLATAHMPWKEAPPVLDDHTEWQGREGRSVPIFRQRSLESEVAMRMSRFKRIRRDKEAKSEPESLADLYLDNVLYDLAVVERVLAAGPRGDQLILVMGDHQPPMVALDTGPEVPVHVLASDPALLQGFFDAGFEGQLRPRTTIEAQVEHRQLLAVALRALHKASRAP